MSETTRMGRDELHEWEQMLAHNQGDERAVLYRDKNTGKVDWIMAFNWSDRAHGCDGREVLGQTTVREAVAFKWMANN